MTHPSMDSASATQVADGLHQAQQELSAFSLGTLGEQVGHSHPEQCTENTPGKDRPPLPILILYHAIHPCPARKTEATISTLWRTDADSPLAISIGRTARSAPRRTVASTCINTSHPLRIGPGNQPIR